MFKKKPNVVTEERDRIILEMGKLDPTSEEYAKAAENLEALNHALDSEKRNKVSQDTIVTLGVQTAIMGLVALITKTNLLPKATQWLPKGRKF